MFSFKKCKISEQNKENIKDCLASSQFSEVTCMKCTWDLDVFLSWRLSLEGKDKEPKVKSSTGV